MVFEHHYKGENEQFVRSEADESNVHPSENNVGKINKDKENNGHVSVFPVYKIVKVYF